VVLTASWVLRNPELLETHTLRDLMAGNLCRCTGYDGIVDSLAAALREAGVEPPARDGPFRPGPHRAGDTDAATGAGSPPA
jgi:xanthine dehydrogenase iron-sulfur cluster and FAD-binding subunit A